MARYFFHIHDGKDVDDDVGADLDGRAAIHAAALQRAGDAIKVLGEDFWDRGKWSLMVTDELGNKVLELVFAGTTSRP